MMNIGDKVRFLNAVGGGKITGFQGKDLVLVCDDDGFEVPTLRTEVVVVETDGYNFTRAERGTKASSVVLDAPDAAVKEAATSVKAALGRHVDAPDDVDPEEDDWADRAVTFRPRPLERRGGDQLNLHLGFLPLDVKRLSTTRFEAYFVNDSNYFVRYLMLTPEGKGHRLRHEGLVEPNRKVLLEDFAHEDLSGWERIAIQLFVYKTDKPFLLKAPLNATLRIDATRFYKLHAFRVTDFFSTPAIVIDLVRDDRPVVPLDISAEVLQEALAAPKDEPLRRPLSVPSSPAAVPGKNIVEVDLHASEILETTSGMESKDILMCQLKVFHEAMKAHAKERGRRIVFIHGKGEGVLRAELLKELRRYYPRCTHQDASFREYGFGATMVTIR